MRLLWPRKPGPVIPLTRSAHRAALLHKDGFRQHHMNPLIAVHQFSNVHVAGHASEHVSFIPAQVFFRYQKIDHFPHRNARGFIQLLVEAHADVMRGRLCARVFLVGAFLTMNCSVPCKEVSRAVMSTSPFPWPTWPSPTSNNAPGAKTGRYSVAPATSSLLSILPACRLGGALSMRPNSGGGATPMLPKKGCSGISIPGANLATMRSLSSGIIFILRYGKSSGRNPRVGPKAL